LKEKTGQIKMAYKVISFVYEPAEGECSPALMMGFGAQVFVGIHCRA
jgi:hypothetical protein